MFATVFVAALAVSGTRLSPKAGPSPVAMHATAKPAARRAALARAHEPERAEDLYSPRARRRIAAYLQMRMLEMRAEGLQKAADVIEGRSPLRTLFEEDASPAPYR